jgi:hypothetical protein
MLQKEAANRLIMAKSHLLPGTKLESAGAVLRDLVALDTNNLEDAYFSLYLRTRSFNVQAFEKGLYKGTSMARIKGLKNYMQVIPAEYLAAVRAVTNGDREAAARNLLKTWGIGDGEYAQVSGKILEVLGDKEKTLVQLKKDLAPVSRDIVKRKKEKAMNVSIVAQAMMDRWILLRGGIGRNPGENPGRFSTFRGRFGKEPEMGRDMAISTLARLYFREYGPATAGDLAWWLGITPGEASSSINKLKGLATVEISGVDGQFFMPDEDERTVRDMSSGNSAILLPRDDPYVKAYYDDDRFVPPGHSAMTKFGESASVVLLDGTVWGTWNIEKETLRDVCIVHLFEGHPEIAGLEDIIKKAAEEAGFFYTGRPVDVNANF